MTASGVPSYPPGGSDLVVSSFMEPVLAAADAPAARALLLAGALRPTINAQTGTAYTITAADEGAIVTQANAAAVATTFPTNATTALPVGFTVTGVQAGAGIVTLGGAGITFVVTPGLKTRTTGSVWSATKIATDTWLVAGDLTS